MEFVTIGKVSATASIVDATGSDVIVAI